MGLRLTPAQFKAITLYRYGVSGAVRPRGIPKITSKDYGYVLDRWKQFDKWNAWKDVGFARPRPPDVWKRVPKWDGVFSPWDLRKAILDKRPTTPQPSPLPTPPPPPVAHKPFQYVLFMGQSLLEALPAQAHYKVAATADPAYDSFANRADADKLREAGHEIYVWYVPTQVSRARAEEIAQRLGTSVIIGQCESAAEFDVSLAHGCKAMVGNVHSLREDQRAKIRSGAVVLVQEDYWNVQPWSQRDYDGVIPAGACIAVYDGHSEHPDTVPVDWKRTVKDYIAAGRLFPGDGLYGPGASPADFRAMP